MVQSVKAFANKPGDPSEIPRTPSSYPLTSACVL